MYYVDTSALVKLIVVEEFSSELRAWAGGHDRELVTGDLVRTELMRAVQRVSATLMPTLVAVLDAIDIITPSPATFAAAGRLQPATLKSLDALHVAAALELGDELDGFVAYDHRLISAAQSNGLSVLAPGANP